MSLFGSLGSSGNPLSMLQQLKQNPAEMLRQAGFNVPPNVTNPQQIVNHLLQSGQVSNAKLAQAQQMMQRFR